MYRICSNAFMKLERLEHLSQARAGAPALACALLRRNAGMHALTCKALPPKRKHDSLTCKE